jgi:hypothetical protein
LSACGSAVYAIAGIQLPRQSHGNSAVGAGSTFRWTLFDKIFLEKLMVTNPVNNVPILIEREERHIYKSPLLSPVLHTTSILRSSPKIHFNILPPMPFSDNCHFHLVLSTKTARIFILF